MRVYAMGSVSAVRQIIDHGFLAEPSETIKLTQLRNTEETQIETTGLAAGVLEFARKPPRDHTAVLPGTLPFVISLDIPDNELGEDIKVFGEEDEYGVSHLSLTKRVPPFGSISGRASAP
jgi:hypothetical protein